MLVKYQSLNASQIEIQTNRINQDIEQSRSKSRMNLSPQDFYQKSSHIYQTIVPNQNKYQPTNIQIQKLKIHDTIKSQNVENHKVFDQLKRVESKLPTIKIDFDQTSNQSNQADVTGYYLQLRGLTSTTTLPSNRLINRQSDSELKNLKASRPYNQPNDRANVKSQLSNYAPEESYMETIDELRRVSCKLYEKKPKVDRLVPYNEIVNEGQSYIRIKRFSKIGGKKVFASPLSFRPRVDRQQSKISENVIPLKIMQLQSFEQQNQSYNSQFQESQKLLKFTSLNYQDLPQNKIQIKDRAKHKLNLNLKGSQIGLTKKQHQFISKHVQSTVTVADQSTQMFEDYYPNQTTDSLIYDLRLPSPHEINSDLYRRRRVPLYSDSSDEDSQ